MQDNESVTYTAVFCERQPKMRFLRRRFVDATNLTQHKFGSFHSVGSAMMCAILLAILLRGYHRYYCVYDCLFCHMTHIICHTKRISKILLVVTHDRATNMKHHWFCHKRRERRGALARAQTLCVLDKQ